MPDHQATNALINETSPYLLQHAHNPVNWYPWSEEAFSLAYKDNKLIIVSIGYSTCHWCHVMEKESFTDEKISEFMNQHFICIKVDREERPDVDAEYMNFVQALTGSGGWPLNIVVLSDKKPVYGGTYFPPEKWMEFLEYMISIKNNNPSLLYSQSEDIVKSLKNIIRIPSAKTKTEITQSNIHNFTNRIISASDKINGGMRGAPKFPMPLVYDYLLHYHFHSKSKDVKEVLLSTLLNMASGGIYDHPGGGFFRYSTDHKWFLPHFEKMLYDNALLIDLYSKAYQHFEIDHFLNIAIQSGEFVIRELLSADNEFFTALDADSEGIEGKFYVWSYKELQHLIKKDFEIFCEVFQIEEHGNWMDGNNILYKKKNLQNTISKYEISPGYMEELLRYWKKNLLSARNSRVRPSLDNKVIVSLNALAIKAFIALFKASGVEKYLKLARKNASYIKDNMLAGEVELYRINDGKKTIKAFLDDYAYYISALIELFQVSQNQSYLSQANKLAEHVMNEFSIENSTLLSFTTNQSAPIIARNTETSDNVMPSSNSVMAKNLFFLGIFLDKRDYIIKAREMTNSIFPDAIRNPAFFANWGTLFLHFYSSPVEIDITGIHSDEIIKTMQKKYLPNAIYSWHGHRINEFAKTEQKTNVTLCRDRVCGLPIYDAETAVAEIINYKAFVDI